jgi:hypothetical protein
LRLGLLERDAVVAVVDAGDDVAGRDMLVVGDRDGSDVADGLGASADCRAAMKASSVDWKRSA